MPNLLENVRFKQKNVLIHVAGTQEGYLKYKSRHFCKLLKKHTSKNIDFGMQMAFEES